jgi:hypothetical protein
MQRRRFARWIAFAFLLVGSVHSGAQSGGGIYRVDRVVIVNGGGAVGGGSYALSATLSQSATDLLAASDYRLQGGVWSGIADRVDVVFTNGFDP